MRNGGKIQKIITSCIIALALIEAISVNVDIQREKNVENVENVDIQREKNVENVQLEVTKDITYLLINKKLIENKNTSKGIEFSTINTSEKTFKKLIKKCNKKIQKYNTENYNSSSSGYNTKITEDTFIDNIENIKHDTVTEKMKLADTVYFQDKIIAVYTNEYEEVKTLGAISNKKESKIILPYSFINTEEENDETIETFEEKELKQIFNTFESSLYLGKYKVNIDRIRSDDILTEEKYLEYLGDELNSIIQNNKEDSEETNLCVYMENNSSELCNYIIGIIKDSEKLEFIDIGKSAISLNYKDRIIVQIDNGKKEYITIMLKLNKYYKIYDVDII